MSRVRWVVLGLAALVSLAGVAFVSMGLGYWVHQRGGGLLYRMIAGVEARVVRLRGTPSPTEQRVTLLETTFLQLRGEVWEEPDNDFVAGGALTVWGEDLLVLDHRGRVMRFREDRGLEPLPIAAPENGLADYRAAAATPAYAGYQHDFGKFRYNDLLLVEAPGLRGLAISYTHFDAARACYGNRVSWLPLDPGVISVEDLRVASGDWTTIFDSVPCQKLNPVGLAVSGIQAGGRLAFRAPSTLFLTHGDYALDGFGAADGGLQSDDSSFGKILAIDLATRTTRIVSKGHRNPTGIALDATGRVWVVEHGPRGGDELNLIEEGGNYGWPLQTLGTGYSGQPLPTDGTYGRHDRYRQPVFAWLPSTAPSSLITIHGIDPSWDGDLLAGSLSNEEFGNSLWHIRLDGDRVVFTERIRLRRRIRDVEQWGERIAVWLDSNELVLFRAERRADPLLATLARVGARYDAATAAAVGETLERCGQCHSFAQGGRGAGPSLNGVFGRAVATAAFDGYSAALKAAGGVWDGDRLGAFLSDPATFAPGSVMADPGLGGQQALLEAVIWALQQTDAKAEPELSYD
jgi:cytochrome c2